MNDLTLLNAFYALSALVIPKYYEAGNTINAIFHMIIWKHEVEINLPKVTRPRSGERGFACRQLGSGACYIGHSEAVSDGCIQLVLGGQNSAVSSPQVCQD